MLEIIEDLPNKRVKISSSTHIPEIKTALFKTLYVPDPRLKGKVIQTLLEYVESKLKNPTYKMKPLIASRGHQITGFMIALIHPTYRSYSRKCGTFGWLNAADFESCKGLIFECEHFMRENKIRKLRGNINFPKGLGGIGIQFKGFEHRMMYGVAFSDPNSHIIEYLVRLGYQKESEYTCMKVTKEVWPSGRLVSKDIRLGYLSLPELKERREDILELSKKCFQGSVPLPDTSGENRLDEVFDTYAQVPPSHYKLDYNFDPKVYSNIPEFIEAWENRDIENIVNWAPLAFDRKTDKLVGAIISAPDVYQMWLNEPITRNNVDTAMVDKNYAGKGIFSALNNIGQLTCNLNGVNYYEGTTIWYNNKDAINSIFPHCKHIRGHYVMQKRIKKR